MTWWVVSWDDGKRWVGDLSSCPDCFLDFPENFLPLGRQCGTRLSWSDVTGLWTGLSLPLAFSSLPSLLVPAVLLQNISVNVLVLGSDSLSQMPALNQYTYLLKSHSPPLGKSCPWAVGRCWGKPQNSLFTISQILLSSSS